MDNIPILRNIDKHIGNLIIFILSLFKTNAHKSSRIEKPKNVLIIRLWTLGESLLILPMIMRLKKDNYTISVLITKRSKGVFENIDFVDEIVELEDFWKILKKFKKYDIIIDTEPYFNISAIMGWFLGKKVIGFKGLFRDMLYDFKIEYHDRAHAVYNFCNLLNPFEINYKPERLVPLKYLKKDMENVDKLVNYLLFNPLWKGMFKR